LFTVKVMVYTELARIIDIICVIVVIILRAAVSECVWQHKI